MNSPQKRKRKKKFQANQRVFSMVTVMSKSTPCPLCWKHESPSAPSSSIKNVPSSFAVFLKISGSPHVGACHGFYAFNITWNYTWGFDYLLWNQWKIGDFFILKDRNLIKTKVCILEVPLSLKCKSTFTYPVWDLLSL